MEITEQTDIITYYSVGYLIIFNRANTNIVLSYQLPNW